MDVAALVAWVVTAGGGFVLLGIWVAKGGFRQQETQETRFPAALILGHFLLAAAGLLVWIGFLVSDETVGLAWTGFGILLPVALLGFVMLNRWWRGRQVSEAPAAGVEVTIPAEQRFPIPIVALHGLLAVTTLVLVLLASLDAT